MGLHYTLNCSTPGGLPDPHTIVGADPSKDTALDEQRSILHSSLASTNVIPRLRRVLRGSGGPAESLHPGNVEMEPEVIKGRMISNGGIKRTISMRLPREIGTISCNANLIQSAATGASGVAGSGWIRWL